MRRALISALTLALVWLAVPATPVLAAAQAKVVVVVGPAGGLTAHYKADADAIAAEARRYTSDVVRIYTPNATWARVKAAAQGANVLVYLGHGNGWPSIYGPFQTVTKDGLGLDPGSGANSTRTVYYGEDFIRKDILLAPNAVVLLYHLCYASGNTEPGLAAGTFSQARQRVDNYGAGFIGAGARAVFAEGHPAHPPTNLIRRLFTTNRTMEALFRGGPTAHGNVLGPYESQRTPGLQLLMDPDTDAPAGFYRSLIGDGALTASQVVASKLVRTDADPADPAARDTTPVEAWTLDTSASWLSPNGDNVNDGFSVAARFSESAAATLRIRNKAGKTVKKLSSTGEITRLAWNLKTATDAPVPDGAYTWSLRVVDAWANKALTRSGTFTVDGTAPVSRAVPGATAGDNGWFVSPVSMTLTSKDALSGVRSIAWRIDGGTTTGYDGPVRIMGDGVRTLEYRATDKAGVREGWKSVELRIDTRAPVVTLVPSGAAGDAAGTWRGPVAIEAAIKDATSGVKAKRFSVDGGDTAALGADPIKVKRDGSHTVAVTAVDKAGNRTSTTLDFVIDTKAPVIELPAATETVPTVTPNGDRSGEQVAIPFSVSEPGSVTAVVTAPDATVLRTIAAPMADGDNALEWDGRTDAGKRAADGRYLITLTPRDLAGNAGKPETIEIDVYAALAALARSPKVFFPQDGDSLARKSTATFTLRSPASVTIQVVDEDGTVVRTGMTDRSLPAGSRKWAWNGRTDAGTFAPRGAYRIVVAATNGTQRAVQRVPVHADAFTLSPSVASAVRGTAFTVTAVSAEQLSTTPRIVVRQPGLEPWSVKMTKLSTTTWTADVKPRKGGEAGPLTLVVKATDSKGGANASTVRMVLE